MTPMEMVQISPADGIREHFRHSFLHRMQPEAALQRHSMARIPIEHRLVTREQLPLEIRTLRHALGEGGWG
jgi:hypothetical protein